MTRAGTPATSVRGGTFLVTIAPDATMAPSPMAIPLRMVARPPTQTLSPLSIGAVPALLPRHNWRGRSQLQLCARPDDQIDPGKEGKIPGDHDLRDTPVTPQ
jgi:hypothetical protein